MGTLRLCYGVYYDIDTWRLAVDIPKNDGQSKSCGFCFKKNPRDNNYCGHCGRDIKDVSVDLTPPEMIDICMRISNPPIPVQVLADVNNVYICQVLADDLKGTLAEFKRPIKTFQWERIKGMIESYAAQLNLPAETAKIFAYGEEKG